MTNDSNQHRVNANQTLIVGLGRTFNPANAFTPTDGATVDEGHATPGTTCYACHKDLDPLRDFFRQSYSYSGMGRLDSADGRDPRHRVLLGRRQRPGARQRRQRPRGGDGRPSALRGRVDREAVRARQRRGVRRERPRARARRRGVRRLRLRLPRDGARAVQLAGDHLRRRAPRPGRSSAAWCRRSPRIASAPA